MNLIQLFDFTIEQEYVVVEDDGCYEEAAYLNLYFVK